MTSCDSITIPRSCLFTSSKYRSKSFSVSRSSSKGQISDEGRAKTTEKTTLPGIEKETVLELWNIEDIEYLPDAACFHPLERTRISIEEATPRKAARRLRRCLRDLSIATTPKRNKLLAESLDHVHFYARLFKERSDHGYRVMLELQRKRGDSLSFIKMAHIIMQAVQGVDISNSNGMAYCNSASSLRPEQLRKAASEIFTIADMKHDILGDLHITAEMMRSAYIDTNLLGWENLFFLTDEDSTLPPASLYVAGVILQGGANDSEYLQKSVETVICYSKHRKKDLKDEDDLLDGFGSQCNNKIHYYALAVLANSLHIWSGHGVHMQPVIHSEKWLGKDGLLCALLCNLSTVEKYPHDAYQAMRCLNTLFKVSSKVRARATELGAQDMVISSRCTGHCSHALLAEESDAAMKTLMGASARSSAISRQKTI